MPANRRPFIVLAGLATAVLALLGWQRQTTLELRETLAWQRAQDRERARLAAEHQRLNAAQATVEEIDHVLADRVAVAQLRSELAAVQRRAREATAARLVTRAEPPPATPSLAGNVLAFQRWRNAGQATPAAAFETILWASAAGDVDALARLLVLDPAARTQAQALFAQLPPALRQEFISPERLVACLTAKDVPLGSATILNQFPTPTQTKVTAQIFDAEGKPKLALFSLHAENDRWQLVVPERIVQRYAAWLHNPPAPGAGGRNP